MGPEERQRYRKLLRRHMSKTTAPTVNESPTILDVERGRRPPPVPPELYDPGYEAPASVQIADTIAVLGRVLDELERIDDLHRTVQELKDGRKLRLQLTAAAGFGAAFGMITVGALGLWAVAAAISALLEPAAPATAPSAQHVQVAPLPKASTSPQEPSTTPVEP